MARRLMSVSRLLQQRFATTGVSNPVPLCSFSQTIPRTRPACGDCPSLPVIGLFEDRVVTNFRAIDRSKLDRTAFDKYRSVVNKTLSGLKSGEEAKTDKSPSKIAYEFFTGRLLAICLEPVTAVVDRVLFWLAFAVCQLLGMNAFAVWSRDRNQSLRGALVVSDTMMEELMLAKQFREQFEKHGFANLGDEKK